MFWFNKIYFRKTIFVKKLWKCTLEIIKTLKKSISKFLTKYLAMEDKLMQKQWIKEVRRKPQLWSLPRSLVVSERRKRVMWLVADMESWDDICKMKENLEYCNLSKGARTTETSNRKKRINSRLVLRGWERSKLTQFIEK